MRRLLLILILAVLGLRATGFVVDAWFRMRTPLEAFFFEATMVHKAWLFERGRSMYPPWNQPKPPHFHNFYGPCYFAIVGQLGSWQDANLDQLFSIGRIVTFAAALTTSVVLGIWTARRFQNKTLGLIAGLASWGALPMFGFAEMVRPDLLAETFGWLGFVMATSTRRRWLWALGILSLALAILTKQPAGLFLIGTACAIGVEQSWKRASVTFAFGLGVAGAIAVLWSLTGEPLLIKSLIGETGAPWNGSHWLIVVQRWLTLSPDMAIATALGILLWITGAERQPGWAAFAAVILLGSLATAAKSGSDQNYFLSLRLVEGMAAASLFAAAFAPSMKERESRKAKVFWRLAFTGWLISLTPGTLESWRQAAQSQRFDEIVNRSNRLIPRTYQKLYDIARDPGIRILTDSGALALRQDERAAFTDPWGFRTLTQTGRLNPQIVRRNIEEERYDFLFLTSVLHDKIYETYEFGLPETLYRAARDHYMLKGQDADLFVYAPKSASAQASKEGP